MFTVLQVCSHSTSAISVDSSTYALPIHQNSSEAGAGYPLRLQIQMQNPALQRNGDRVRPIRRAEFANNILHMHFNGPARSP